MHKAFVCNNVVRIIVFSIIECKNPDHLNAKLMNLFRIDTFKLKNEFKRTYCWSFYSMKLGFLNSYDLPVATPLLAKYTSSSGSAVVIW